MDDPIAITDPAGILLALGSIIGLFAAFAWIGVVKSIAKMRDGGKADWERLSTAAVATAFAMGLTSGGYLLGFFSGRF